MDGDDIGMRETSHRLRLAHEASGRAPAITRQIGVQQLECDLAIETRVSRRIDHAHATLSEPRVDDVASNVFAGCDKGRARAERDERRRPRRCGEIHRWRWALAIDE